MQLLYLRDPVAITPSPTEQSIRGLRAKVGAIWQAIERACAADDFRPRPGPLCNWCAFKAYCPAFGGDPATAPSAAVDPPVDPAVPVATPVAVAVTVGSPAA